MGVTEIRKIFYDIILEYFGVSWMIT